MHRQQKKQHIFVDGEVLIADHFSGIGHYTLSMLRAIDSLLESDYGSEFDVSIIVYFRRINRIKKFNFKNIKIIPSLFSQRISNGLKVHDVPLPLDTFFGKGVYIFPNFTTWPLRASKSIPFIYDVSYEKYPQFADPRNQVFLSTQVSKSVSRASHIATISNSAKDDVHQFYNAPLSKMGTYYPAVDMTHYYRRSPEEIREVKRKYSLPDNYTLFVGNIEPRKNLINLLLAYEKIPLDEQRQHPIVLVGAKGWQDGEIFTVINRLKRHGVKVIFPSKYVVDDDLPVIYSGAQIFVYPSIYEGFGIPPIEAMACGVPVICADNSSLPEAAGNAALYVDALSVESIASALHTLLSDSALRSRLVKKGASQINKFSWQESAQDLLDTIRELQ